MTDGPTPDGPIVQGHLDNRRAQGASCEFPSQEVLGENVEARLADGGDQEEERCQARENRKSLARPAGGSLSVHRKRAGKSVLTSSGGLKPLDQCLDVLGVSSREGLRCGRAPCSWPSSR